MAMAFVFLAVAASTPARHPDPTQGRKVSTAAHHARPHRAPYFHDDGVPTTSPPPWSHSGPPARPSRSAGPHEDGGSHVGLTLVARLSAG